MTGEQRGSPTFPLLRLPLELRRYVYEYSLWSSRAPAADTIYSTVPCPLNIRLEARPSSLLFVSRETRHEAFAMIQGKNWPVHLHVTPAGVQFSTLAQTYFIVRKCLGLYGKIRHLVIEMWPSHPDRPVDAIIVWRHLRRLVIDLRDMAVLQQVTFRFADNEMATWTRDGKVPMLLANSDDEVNDFILIAELFGRVRAVSASFEFPYGLARGEATVRLHKEIGAIEAGIEGRIPIDDNLYNEKWPADAARQDADDHQRETALIIAGTKIARNKLIKTTHNGQIRKFSTGLTKPISKA
ncbi:MAG: hypothetical protein Q9218_002676 [Villophora microphyllina]